MSRKKQNAIIKKSITTFLSGGKFDTEIETVNFSKYYKTKFFRALLGIKKVTQHCPPSVWKTIPLQDFTTQSDIRWDDSISGIDKQLYRKYKLTKEETQLIETMVEEMED